MAKGKCPRVDLIQPPTDGETRSLTADTITLGLAVLEPLGCRPLALQRSVAPHHLARGASRGAVGAGLACDE